MTAINEISLFARAHQFRERQAIVTSEGTYNYGELLGDSAKAAMCLLDGRCNLNETRVAFLVSPGYHYTAVQWGIWRAGGIAVPLCVQHPTPEMEYVIEDSDADIVIIQSDVLNKLQSSEVIKGRRFLCVSDLFDEPATRSTLPEIAPDKRALILYTSGTTDKPKGVVSTHSNIEAQVQSLITAWKWTKDDYILNVLPMHHIHGIVNVQTCALWSGAVCESLPSFDAGIVWEQFLEEKLTLFMAVPTIYVKLIAAWETVSPDEQEKMSAACRKMRLMVSGSAALPVSVLEKWKTISGHVLLERYGMTETGMILSNPLNSQRRAGFVGTPLPGVDVRLIDDNGAVAAPGSQGEVHVKGSNVFHEYWNKPDETKIAFQDGWFITGDVCVVENGSYRLLGRKSVDIIKTGGYKVSALEIEEVLRTHPDISECAVVGLDDAEWGQRVCAALVLNNDAEMSLESLREWARELIAVYKIPTVIQKFDVLPRNTMGKVSKPKIVKVFQQ
ncbi:acyl-CoA synthetase [candidate division KSB1 bacterium]